MEIKCYKTPGDFLQDNREFLQRFEAASQLNLGNAQAHRDEPCHRDELCAPELLFGRCEEEGRGVLLFGNTPPWNLCLNAIPGDVSALSAAVLLAEYLRRERIELRGITASRPLCDAFAFAYGGRFQLHTAMDIMVLTELIEPPAVSGQVRKAALSDLDTVTDWGCAFTEECLREKPDREKLLETFRGFVENEKLYVLEGGEGKLLSMAVSNRKLPHGWGVSWVYTPLEQRGKGYCQNTVAALCGEKLKSGAEYITLFVDKANPCSNRAYSKIGFRVLEDSCDYRLEPEE